ncbi:MAG: hypothetical protein Q8K75_00490 [Chlamydiales bacterium]|nr:hypothetical protein [Chlamydiales bacterium]
MMKKTSPTTSNSWLLPSVLVAAVALHLMFFFALNDMPLFSGTSRPWSLSEKNPEGTSSPVEVAKKNIQLAKVFKHIIAEASGGQTASLPTALETLPASLESLSVDWTDSPDDHATLQSELHIDREDFLSAPLAIDLVIPNNKTVVDDVILASEALLGDVELLTMDLYEPDGARVGQIDLASLQGNSMDSRSGMRQHGLMDDDRSASPVLAGSNELSGFDQLLQQQIAREHKTLTGQLDQRPATNELSSMSKRDSTGDRALAGAEAAGHIAGSSDFSVALEYAPKPNGEGFLFRLTLKPKPGVEFKTIKHNVFFLVDRSHSIDKNRYQETKNAVADALDILRESDTFNIHVFDSNVVSFSAQNVPATARNKATAREFLAAQPYGGLFASTDLYGSLGNIIPAEVGPQELNTAILLSDGETSLSKDRQRQHIAAWTSQNGGKVDLYSLAVGKGNNLPLLDLLTSLNKGQLVYVPALGQLQNGMSDLFISLQNPIGKEIVSNAVPLSENTVVNLYPRQERLPNLYKDCPYVLYGSCSQTDDFYLFLQGKYYDRFLDIQQLVSFREGKEIPAIDLERHWAIIQAYELYDSYLEKGNHSNINAARRLLAPFGIPVAFQ